MEVYFYKEKSFILNVLYKDFLIIYYKIISDNLKKLNIIKSVSNYWGLLFIFLRFIMC